MKKITLTTLTLVILLVTFSTASASFGGDDKCKTKCCKAKKNKELSVALADLEKAMNKLEAELKTVTILVRTETRKSLAQNRVFTARPVRVISYASSFSSSPTPEETVTVDAKYKIDFKDLGKEMERVQQDMTIAPPSQSIDFSNISKEMDEAQERMSSFPPVNM